MILEDELLEAMSLPIDDDMVWELTMGRSLATAKLVKVSNNSLGYEFRYVKAYETAKTLAGAMSNAWCDWQAHINRSALPWEY